MAFSYQDFVHKARERFEAKQKRSVSGTIVFTRHARFKMRQYGLSEQRVRRVLRAPRRTEEGIAPTTTAMMQPVSVKRDPKGKEKWSQEIWVMFTRQDVSDKRRPYPMSHIISRIKIISAWRYPGISPKRNPIPEEILRELAEGSILEADE